jgi:NIMA (never in mitosis gene a)-related kinase
MTSNRPDKYKVIQKLGEKAGGWNGGIVLVSHRGTGELRVEKKLNPKWIREGRADQERDTLERLRDSASVTTLLDSYISHSRVEGSLFLEYCDGGSMYDLIKRHQAAELRIPERAIWEIFLSLAQAIQYCHLGANKPPYSSRWKPILHCDIKPDNVLVKLVPRSPLGFVIKLADFGWSQVLPAGERSCKTEVHAMGFKVPEWPKYSTRSDVWAIGATVVCLCLLSKEPPGGKSPIPRHYSQELVEMIQGCMQYHEGHRTSSKDLADKILTTAVKLWPTLPSGAGGVILPGLRRALATAALEGG